MAVIRILLHSINLAQFPLIESTGRAVIGSMQHHADGVTTMKLAYTGTQQDAAAARDNARKFGMQGAAHAPPSLIRDHTGSGVENIPEPNSAPVAGKVRGVTIYTMGFRF